MDGALDEAYGEPLLEDATGDNLEQVPHLDLLNFYTLAMMWIHSTLF